MPLLHARLERSVLSVAPAPEPAATARMGGRRLVETLRRLLDERPREAYFRLPPAVYAGPTILALLADDPELLREPLAPLTSLLEGSGLESHGSWIGYAGTDWAAIDEFFGDEDDWLLEDADPDGDWAGADDWMTDEDRSVLESDDEALVTEHLAERSGLSEDTVEGLKVVMGAYELSLGGRGLEDARSLALIGDVMSDPSVALVLGTYAAGHSEIEPFVASIEQHALGASAAGPRYVLAVCTEARDDLTEAEAWLRAALEADPAYEVAAYELARFEIDRGRYGEAARLLRASGAPPDDPVRAWLEGVGRSALPKVGRNEPCPCGSGRKFKVCHLGREGDVASVDAAGALLQKLWRWLDRPGGRRLAHDLTLEARPDEALSEEDDDERALLANEFIDDILLFDRGQLERFVALHQSIVPPPELELARIWIDSRRSLYEVRSVRPGSLVVRDLVVSGPDVELADQALSRQAERLDLLCLRLVPDGSDGLMPTTAMSVPRAQRERVVEILGSGDAVRLVRWIVEPVALPQLANMEGEPLRMVEASYRLPDPMAAAMVLARTLEPDGEGRFVDLVEHKGQDLLRGSIRIEGDEAHLEANSRQRADRIERTLLDAAPGSRLIRRTERGIEEALKDTELRRERVPSGPSEPSDPETERVREAVLEQFIRDHERRWLDESIPALDGMTPRQARDDAAMRPRLEALLDDMEWHMRRAPAGSMDAGRVRALLGLDAGDEVGR
jgi:tetratricopeptide (TPR) repeat protein